MTRFDITTFMLGWASGLGLAAAIVVAAAEF